MISSLTIWNVVILAAMLQGVLLTLFLLLNKKGNRKANIFLALLVLLYAIDIGLETLYASPQIFDFPHLIGLNDPLFFLYGPLLYLYAYFLSSPRAGSDKKWLLHFLPFLIIVIFYLPTLFLQSAEFKLSSEGRLPAVLHSFMTADVRGRVELISGFHELIYIVLTLFLLSKHAQAIKDSFSAIDRINLKWLKNLTLATGAIVTVDLLLYFFINAELLAYGNAVTLILFLCATLIYAIGYMGLMQPLIFSPASDNIPVTPVLPDNEESGNVREKYYKSTLTDQQAEDSLAKLLELMETQQLYLNGELKLSDVAEALGISTNNLSQIINDKLNKNFYDFVNAYRVEAARKLLADPEKDNLTLLAIAFDAGFNSKSTFNSVFKKHCQLTPSEYKKSIAKEMYPIG